MQFTVSGLTTSSHSGDSDFMIGAGMAPAHPADVTAAPVAAAQTDSAAQSVSQPVSQADLLQRLEQMESFHIHLNGAVESLVDTILHLRNHDVAGLQTQVRDLERQLHLERENRDLTEVSRMHPKERIVVFVGGTYFGDNIKYAWLAAHAQAKKSGDFQCWFLPFNAEQEKTVRAVGGRCLPHTANDWSAEHLHVALSAAVAVISDHLLGSNPYAASLLAGARQVQMWHGVSIKEIGFRNLGPLKNMSPQYARVLKTCGRFSSFVGTAERNESEWRRWFAFDRYAPIGYARNDVLHRTPEGHDLLNVDMDALGRAQDFMRRGRRVFLYAPTFRDAEPGRWILRAGLDRIARAIADAGDCLLVNLHPVEQPAVPEMAKALPGVVFVKPRTDVYPLLTLTTALVTDYSSIMFDYLHLDRPVLLFRPDHESYTTHSRKLFDAKLAHPPGPVASNAQALIDLLSPKKSLESVSHTKARQQLAADLYDRRDGSSAQRLVDLLREELQRSELPA